MKLADQVKFVINLQIELIFNNFADSVKLLIKLQISLK